MIILWSFLVVDSHFYSVNILDIAPQFASLIMGLSNTAATIPGIISPMITGYIVQNKVNIIITTNAIRCISFC